MTHLTNSQVDAYWCRKLAPAELLSLAAHIGQCPQCQNALMAAAPPAGFTLMEEPAEHLEYLQIEEYVKGTAAAEARAVLESHIAGCELCRAEVEDLRRFGADFQPRPTAARRAVSSRGPWPRSRWLLATAGLAAAVCLAVMAIRPSYPVLLHDGGQSLGLDRQGRLRGLANLPDAESRMLAAILSGGSLPVASPRPELTGNGGVTRGAGESPAEFAVRDPLGRVTLDDRPQFGWTALPGASSYRLQVLDLDYRLVAESPPLSTTQWRPEKPLPRGSTYSWEVTAHRGGAEVRSPQPPTSEARFAVLDQARAGGLNAALARVPVSHLELSALYAEAGMVRECLQELRSLEAENPGSALPGRLQRQLPR